ncbi:uncharacterized protein [Drosophila kikkawai]|uniref:Reverse transcriptase domain-containing protein n=1 Tax=Drosophila kikkawai TaxID=30033 RepID=A0ABM4GN65_DROKI
MYDGALRLPLPGRTELVGFADDIAVFDKELARAEELCDRSISRINSWLSSVARASMLSVAPVWGQALATPAYTRGLCSAHRLAALRISSAFRAVSDQAALVLAGTPPLDLLAAERASIHGQTIGRTLTPRDKQVLRLAAKDATLAASKGRWTYRMIPQLDCWLKRKHGQINFHLTQILSGHGCFRSYLRRLGHEEDDSCTHCQEQLEESAEHTVFNCARFAGERASLEAWLGNTISAENLVPLMLLSEANWQAVSDFTAKAMTELLAEERRRNQEAT